MNFDYPGAWFRGDNEAGAFELQDGGGGHLAVRWDIDGLVGVAFDHESSRSEAAAGRVQPEDYQPLQYLEGLPQSLLGLAKAAAGSLGNLVTAGLWTNEQDLIVEAAGAESHSCHWFNLMNSRLIDHASDSLDDDHIALAEKLALESATGYRISGEDEKILMTCSGLEGRYPSPANVQMARWAMAAAGVIWERAGERLPLGNQRRELMQELHRVALLGAMSRYYHPLLTISPPVHAIVQLDGDEEVGRFRYFEPDGAMTELLWDGEKVSGQLEGWAEKKKGGLLFPGLEQRHHALATALASKLARGPFDLSPEEESTLLTQPAALADHTPTREAARDLQWSLRELGIRWSSLLQRILN